jgi:hypothetical protein
MSSEFGHIYFNDWKIDSKCQRKVGNEIIEMGVVKEKDRSSRPYDRDIDITFEKEGKRYVHTIEFGEIYRQYE